MVKARNYRKEYVDYQGKPEQIKRRNNRNRARAKMIAAGKISKHSKLDIDHKDGNANNNSMNNLQALPIRVNRGLKNRGKR